MAHITLKARQALFQQHAHAIEYRIGRLTFPTTITPAGTIVFRSVGNHPARKLDYFDLFRQLPPSAAGGSNSSFNRWSGKRSDGITPGVSGSYWGSTHGVAAEDFFYTAMKGYDPVVGPLCLLPSMAPLLVQGARTRLPYHAEQGSPEVIPFTGNFNNNILIAKTLRDIEVADMKVTSDRFKEWNHRLSRALRAELDGLEFTDIAAAIEDSEFKEMSRLIGYSAYANAHEGLAAKSVRRDGYQAPVYNPTQADNLIIFGQDNEAFTDKLFGSGVIEIRTNPVSGLEATIKPMTVYAPKQERSLVPLGNANTSVSGNPWSIILSSFSTKSESGSEGKE